MVIKLGKKLARGGHNRAGTVEKFVENCCHKIQREETTLET
jgi:hypothetical protein